MDVFHPNFPLIFPFFTDEIGIALVSCKIRRTNTFSAPFAENIANILRMHKLYFSPQKPAYKLNFAENMPFILRMSYHYYFSTARITLSATSCSKAQGCSIITKGRRFSGGIIWLQSRGFSIFIEASGRNQTKNPNKNVGVF